MGATRTAAKPQDAKVTPYRLPLEAGDHLDQATFHERYKAMPSKFRAELIGGIVIVPSLLSPEHGAYHALMRQVRLR